MCSRHAFDHDMMPAMCVQACDHVRRWPIGEMARTSFNTYASWHCASYCPHGCWGGSPMYAVNVFTSHLIPSSVGTRPYASHVSCI